MDRSQTKFLEELRKDGIVQLACERTPVSRNTVYRWKANKPEFRALMDEAIVEGDALIGDITEDQLLQLAKQGNWNAVKFILVHKNAKFKKGPASPIDAGIGDRLTPEEEEIVNRAIALSHGTQQV